MITALGILLAGVGVGMVYAGATNQELARPIAAAFGFDLPARGAGPSSSVGGGKAQGSVLPRGKAPAAGSFPK